MTNAEVQGGCLCRAIRYRFAGVLLARSLCHCRSCRLAAGAPAVAWVVVKRNDFAFIEGEPQRFRSSAPVVRTFCGKCGNPLTYQHQDSPDTIDVTTSTLDMPDAYPPTREIWLEQTIAWQKLNERLQHFPRDSTGSGAAE